MRSIPASSIRKGSAGSPYGVGVVGCSRSTSRRCGAGLARFTLGPGPQSDNAPLQLGFRKRE
ncbi:hypothetical protein SALB_00707 [Streptomyces noursei]|uniref:Uncharacterized protein n=1 Tax=Streptomyces noursei TaxID=1971 RepID=A0A401QRU5_STRNR|nr:hypothetical protein SALB_00707 [Streptomyces noursei]